MLLTEQFCVLFVVCLGKTISLSFSVSTEGGVVMLF